MDGVCIFDGILLFFLLFFCLWIWMFILSQEIQWNSVKYCICTPFSNEKKCQYAKMNGVKEK